MLLPVRLSECCPACPWKRRIRVFSGGRPSPPEGSAVRCGWQQPARSRGTGRAVSFSAQRDSVDRATLQPRLLPGCCGKQIRHAILGSGEDRRLRAGSGRSRVTGRRCRIARSGLQAGGSSSTRSNCCCPNGAVACEQPVPAASGDGQTGHWPAAVDRKVHRQPWLMPGSPGPLASCFGVKSRLSTRGALPAVAHRLDVPQV